MPFPRYLGFPFLLSHSLRLALSYRSFLPCPAFPSFPALRRAASDPCLHLLLDPRALFTCAGASRTSEVMFWRGGELLSRLSLHCSCLLLVSSLLSFTPPVPPSLPPPSLLQLPPFSPVSSPPFLLPLSPCLQPPQPPPLLLSFSNVTSSFLRPSPFPSPVTRL